MLFAFGHYIRGKKFGWRERKIHNVGSSESR